MNFLSKAGNRVIARPNDNKTVTVNHLADRTQYRIKRADFKALVDDGLLIAVKV